MKIEELIHRFWEDVANQDDVALAEYFVPEAIIQWHNTNEKFTVEEYIRANCEYPGEWSGAVERVELLNDLVISVTRVWLKDNSVSLHVVSFFTLINGKISSLNEYWGDDGIAPQWRLDKNIGKPIK